MSKLKLSKLYKQTLIIGVGLIYYLLFLSELSIPCPINRITGLYCPGCGITRLVSALLSFDFKTAYISNPAIFCLIPIFVYLLIKAFYRYYNELKPMITKDMNLLIWLSVVILIMFTVYRNMQLWHII